MNLKFNVCAILFASGVVMSAGIAHAQTVVALGASNTRGKGVSVSQAYPAQLEALLRAQGIKAKVTNAGVNGDTTAGMLDRLPKVVTKATKVVIFQPGGNDRRKGSPDRSSEIQARLQQMGVKVIVVSNNMLGGKPHQADGVHLTPEGYRMLAQELLGSVVSGLR